MGQKPNILFIFADDQRAGTINKLGNDAIHTPHLDRLVQDGLAFTEAHIPGGSNGAVCMPSRAMLHTGRSLFQIHEEGQSIAPDHKMLGELLQEAGYETFGTGKWHNGVESYARSFTSGDNIFFGGMHDHWNVPVHQFDPTGRYESRLRMVDNFFFSNRTQSYIADHAHTGEHSTDMLASGVIDFLDQDLDKPFFCYLALLAPHDPRTMPDRFRELYDPSEMELPPNFMAMHPIEYGNTDCRDELLAPYPRRPDDTRRQLAEYYGMISHIDHQVGRILDKLEETGKLDNTIVIYSADNGLAIGQHGLFGKQNLYEHSVHVPLIFSGPAIPRGETREQPVYLYDIYPTICELLGIELPEGVDGQSFYRAFSDETAEIRDRLYLAYTDKIRAIRRGPYKYMEHRHEGRETPALYNLEADPYETMNLVYDESYGDTVAELRACLLEEAEASGELERTLGRNYWG